MNASIEDLVALLGERIRELRLRENIAQTVLAMRSGVSLKAVKNLENGTGATVSSLLRVLRTLGRTEWIETLGPKVGITFKDLLEVAEQVGIGTARRELDRVIDAVRNWPTFAIATGVTDKHIMKALI